MEFVQYTNWSNNKDYAFSKANFEKLADEAKKKVNKIYALVMNQNVFGLLEDEVFEGYHFRLLIDFIRYLPKRANKLV